MVYLVLAQLFIFAAFIGYLYSKTGELKSISESWNVLSKQKKYIFTIFCFISGVLIAMHSNTSPMFLLSGAAIAFTGILYGNLPAKKIVHFFTSYLGIILALIGIWIEFGDFVPLGASTAFALLFWIKKYENYTWWIVIFSAIMIFLGLLSGTIQDARFLSEALDSIPI